MSLCSPLCLHSISCSARIFLVFFSFFSFNRSVYYCYHVRRNRLGWNEMKEVSRHLSFADKVLWGSKVSQGCDACQRWSEWVMTMISILKSIPGSRQIHRGESCLWRSPYATSTHPIMRVQKHLIKIPFFHIVIVREAIKAVIDGHSMCVCVPSFDSPEFQWSFSETHFERILIFVEKAH